MRRLSAAAAGMAAWLLPAAAHACTICGQHGDTTRTLFVYGAFMTIPFAMAIGLGVFIRTQLKQLPPNGDPDADPHSGGARVPRDPVGPGPSGVRVSDRAFELV